MRSLLAIAAVLLAHLLVPSPAHAGDSMVGLINGARSGNPLVQNSALASAATAHSEQMATRGEIFHSTNLSEIVSGWEHMGENVGAGRSVDEVFDAFMASPGHRDNILGDYSHVGVGIATDDEGFVWVTVIFMRTSDADAPVPMVLSPMQTPHQGYGPAAPKPQPRATTTRTVVRYGNDATHPIAC